MSCDHSVFRLGADVGQLQHGDKYLFILYSPSYSFNYPPVSIRETYLSISHYTGVDMNITPTGTQTKACFGWIRLQTPQLAIYDGIRDQLQYVGYFQLMVIIRADTGGILLIFLCHP